MEQIDLRLGQVIFVFNLFRTLLRDAIKLRS